jgi:dCMP deaminase
MNKKWDLRFLAAAKFFSTWSKDPSTQTGTVIVDQHGAIKATGYNGFARGVEDALDRLTDRDKKYNMIVHCETNAIVFAQTNLTGFTLYTWPFMPCARCAGMIIQTGISRCVAPQNDNPRWQESFKYTTEMFAEAGVELTLYDQSEIVF